MSIAAQSTGAIPHDDVRVGRRPWGESRIIDWIATTEHTAIGKRFIVTAMIFFLLGGITALIMRLQLARPLQHVVGPDLYNQMFTVHGTNMMFIFAVPVMLGMGVYLVPMMVGAKNIAFPRLTAFSFYLYLFGACFLWFMFFVNTGPDAGWFSYPPLSGPEYSPGKRVDVWAQLITFTEISSLGVATSLIVTIFKHRAPGMSLDRMPIFCWSMLVTSFMVVFAMPAVVVASSCLALDRLVSTQFFNPAEGGDALLFQHMFWFFGHPEVYIIFLPGVGMLSEMVVAASRRPLVGYIPVVLANVATGIMAFGLWVHHMFATGLPQIGSSFFTAASMIIAIPTGVQFFCWIATLWGSRPRWSVSFCYIVAFVGTFLVGGLTGIMLASVPLDLQVHDTFFVVAHLHYVLIGGAIFPLLGAFHHWFPKITGRMLHAGLGRLEALVVAVGFNVTFFPQHIAGLHGMPRRIYTYQPEMGWGNLNLLSTIGAFLLGFGVLLFLVNVIRSLRTGDVAGPDPWGADSLEWSLPSPPPPMRRREVPIVPSRYPLWIGQLGRVTGLKEKELLVTNIVDAEPSHREHAPGPSLSPLFLAIVTGATIIACIFTPWGLIWGIGPGFVALVAWYWPRRSTIDPENLAEEQP